MEAMGVFMGEGRLVLVALVYVRLVDAVAGREGVVMQRRVEGKRMS